MFQITSRYVGPTAIVLSKTMHLICIYCTIHFFGAAPPMESKKKNVISRFRFGVTLKMNFSPRFHPLVLPFFWLVFLSCRKSFIIIKIRSNERKIAVRKSKSGGIRDDRKLTLHTSTTRLNNIGNNIINVQQWLMQFHLFLIYAICKENVQNVCVCVWASEGANGSRIVWRRSNRTE